MTDITPNQLEDTITLSDLVVLRNVVHIASRRGAFSAEEFSDIGTVYNKIDKFLKKHVKEDVKEDVKKDVSGKLNEVCSGDMDLNQSKIEI